MARTKRQSAPTTDRRLFLSGLLAAGLMPNPTWADAGEPAFLAAAATTDGSYKLCGLRADLSQTFLIPLPARGHAAAVHPTRPEAVAFARRPGTFAVVINCATGEQTARLAAPDGRHFYGHGAFSADGTTLYTTENNFAAGRGRIGLWDAANGYRRLGEWDSGGIGPHDIKRLPGTDVLIVANGGIDTHPDTGRTKLNIATMQPNLAYIDQGSLIERAILPRVMHKNSIRHLAVSDTGSVAFGMQWEGDGTPAALVGTHRIGSGVALMDAPRDAVRQMDGYIGSIACTADGNNVAVTSPRGGQVQMFDTLTGALTGTHAIADVSGIAAINDQFVVTNGTGAIAELGNTATLRLPLMFDNHLVPI